MGNILNVKYPSQVMFFEIVDAAITGNIWEWANEFPEHIEPTIGRLCQLQKDEDAVLDEYFSFKSYLFHSPYPLLNDSIGNNLVNLYSFPRHLRAFPRAFDLVDRVTVLLFDSGCYSELEHYAKQMLRVEVLSNVDGIEGVLFTDKQISFCFKVGYEHNVAVLQDFLSQRWFLEFNEPLFNTSK